MLTAVLLMAAGRGQRFGAPLPKQYANLAGKPVLHHAARAVLDHPGVTHVVAIIHPDDRAAYASASQDLPLLQPVNGGATRQESVRRGLESLVELGPDVF